MVRQCMFSIQNWWVVIVILFVIYRISDMKDGIKQTDKWRVKVLRYPATLTVVFRTNSITTELPETTVKTSVNTESDSTHTSLSSSSTPMDLTTTQDQPNTSVSEPSEEPQGLSSGEIAGIAVGSIAGVAVLGGGIYAGLKHTGKLGG